MGKKKTVDCSKKENRIRCKYASSHSEDFSNFMTCDYMIKAGHPRGCPYRKCTRFVEFTGNREDEME